MFRARKGALDDRRRNSSSVPGEIDACEQSGRPFSWMPTPVHGQNSRKFYVR